jgi:hypothetical protein
MSTIETTHNKILEKMHGVEPVVRQLNDIVNSAQLHTNIYFGIMLAELNDLENEYLLKVADVITTYYTNPAADRDCTDNYYRVLNGENFILRVNNFVDRCADYLETINELFMNCPKKLNVDVKLQLAELSKKVEFLQTVELITNFGKIDYKRCAACDTLMEINAELSELQCACGLTSKIIGMVFRDEQFYPQEGQKTKHGGYDPSRHFKFWIDRIQGIENKEFPPGDLSRIEHVITRDMIDRITLNIHMMRGILKELQLTKYNDHAVLLVVMFGGIPPPRLSIDENKKMSILFRKVMSAYEQSIYSGNKPYYPYFIYKIIESIFQYNNEKMQLLNYIHLQSRDTVIKNDKIYEKICENYIEGLSYKPTNPEHRL